jgi:signal transduction histidine kinase
VTHQAPEPPSDLSSRRGPSKRERILATLDQVAQLSEIDEVTEAIARGFVDIGAVMSLLMVRAGECLKVAAWWPEQVIADLYRRGTGKEFSQFTIPLDDHDNPYVAVYQSREPKLLQGPEEVADLLLVTFDGDPAIRQAVVAAASGKAGAVLPLVVGDQAVGIAAIDYADDLTEADLHLFNIFAASAATLLNFKRDVVSREAILADLERALDNERRTRAELNRSERLAALGEMSAVVAHEIRNPLAVIRNSQSSLNRHLADCEQSRLLRGIIDEETRRIERIIDDMLAFSSPLEIRGTRIDIGELIDRAIVLADQRLPQAGESGIVHQRGKAVPEVVVDPRRLTHALVNLLVNATQATEEGGRVSVGARCVEEAGRRWVRVTVVDTGAGIDPEHLSQIYAPFFTTKATGVGLGLVIVKRAVDACGGRLAVDSAAGRGTTVTVDLPPVTDDD